MRKLTPFKTQLPAISLFSGCGGMDFGFEAAGFLTRAANEIDPICCETLRRNGVSQVLEGDVFDLPPERMMEAAGLRRRETALLFGGPPCQPFSKSGFWVSGESKRMNDPRANTLTAYVEMVRAMLPAVFVLENVAGLAFEGKDEGLRFLLDEIEVINRREGVRYRPTFELLRAVEHGVPQLRERLFLVAFRDGASFHFPKPLFGEASHTSDFWPLGRHRTAWDALGDLAEPDDEDLVVGGKWAALLPTIPEGQNYLWHTERGGGEPLFGWRRRFWNFLLKLAKDRPSWTIQAQPGPSTGPFHWNNRRLSMRELCRLQTFPDTVHLVGSLREVQRQAGNAVPSLLTERVGREIARLLAGTPKTDLRLQLLPPDRSPVPAATPLKRVPSRFRHLHGLELEHPGTGLGPGALRRVKV